MEAGFPFELCALGFRDWRGELFALPFDELCALGFRALLGELFALPFEALAPFFALERPDDVRDEPAEDDLRLLWDDVFPLLLEERVLA